MSDYDLCLHVGVSRRSLALRRSLQRLRPQLRAHAVAYLGGQEIDGLRHVGGWDCHAGARPQDASAFGRELAHHVASERSRAAGPLGRRGAVQTLISSDRLLGMGHLGPAEAEQFRPYAQRAVGQVVEALDARQVQIVLYTERQDRLMELAYLRRLQAGDRHSFEEQFPYRFEPVLDYVELIDRLQAIPHVADIVVRPIEFAEAGTHAFVNDFLSILGLGDTLNLYAIGADVSPQAAVFSGRAAQLALAMSPLLETADEVGLVHNYLAKNYLAGERYSTDLLDDDVRARILASYATRNRELFTKHLPDLPADSYLNDPATFTLANLVAHPESQAPPSVPATVAAVAADRVTATRIKLERRLRPVAGRARRAIRRRLR